MALHADTVWEVRTGGSDANGGGYKSSAGTTDYSQQDAAQLTVADGATSGIGSTTLTSVTGGFTAAMVGSIAHLYTGTNLTDGWYEITAYTDTNTVTLDRAPDDGVGGASAVDVKVGGALATLGGLGAVFQVVAQATAGMKAYLKNATYNNSQTAVNVSGGPLDLDVSEMDSKEFYLKGYDSAQGRDSFAGTRPIVHCNANLPANANIIKIKGTYGNCHVAAFIEVNGDSLATSGLRGGSASYDRFYSCVVRDCNSTGGFYTATCVRCYAYSCSARGFYGCSSSWCYAVSNGTGFYNSNCACCISSGNTTFGFYAESKVFANCLSYNNGTDGFRNVRVSTYVNCLSVSDGGYSFNSTDAVDAMLLNCASDGATSGRTNGTPALDEDAITLTADPFQDAAGGDFRLNSAAGGGALCAAAGIGVYGQTDTPDVNAISAVAGAGGGLLTHPGMSGGARG